MRAELADEPLPKPAELCQVSSTIVVLPHVGNVALASRKAECYLLKPGRLINGTFAKLLRHVRLGRRTQQSTD